VAPASALRHRIIATIKEFQSGEAETGMRIVNERQFDRLTAMMSSTSGDVVFGGSIRNSTTT
jgi:aldehyde dehydrogenase (NAD+)